MTLTLVQDSAPKTGAKLATVFPFTGEDDAHYCDCCGCGGRGYFSAEQVEEKLAGFTNLAGASLAVAEAVQNGKLPECKDDVLVIFPGTVWEDEAGIRYWAALEGVRGYTEDKRKFDWRWPFFHKVQEKIPPRWNQIIRPTGDSCPTSTYFALAE